MGKLTKEILDKLSQLRRKHNISTITNTEWKEYEQIKELASLLVFFDVEDIDDDYLVDDVLACNTNDKWCRISCATIEDHGEDCIWLDINPFILPDNIAIYFACDGNRYCVMGVTVKEVYAMTRTTSIPIRLLRRV